MEEQSDTSRSMPRGDHVAVLEASPNAIVAIDTTARIVYVNPKAATTFGYARDDLIGQPIEILLPERLAERHRGHRDEFLHHPVARPMGIGLELSGRRRDQTEFPVEISLSPVETVEGLVVFATVVDITSRKAAESALAESERRFRAVLEASPNAVVAVDDKARITYTNPRVAALFGYARDELVGQPIEVLLPDELAGRHQRHRDGFLEHPVARPMGIGLDLAGRRRDGTEFPVEISLSPVETSEGLSVFATVVDITARKAAEAQLLQAQKLESIGRLAGGIAHDFNNMLFAIRGFSEMLAEDLAGDPSSFDAGDALDRVKAISDAADRATALTAQLLAFSRQQVVSPKVIDLSSAVFGVEPMLRPLIGEHNRLILNLDPNAGRIRVDPSQLDQILVNLAVNARDAMRDGGTITIETGNTVFDEPYAQEHFDVAPGPYVLLAISDTGVGMDRPTREHVFDPFFTTKEVGKGTGLGLATIYGIVQQARGHIWLYSEPNRGSTFKLYFPRVDAEIREDELRPAPAPIGSGRVLVVEDDPAVREMTTQVLERAGYRVTAVEDGMQALEMVDRMSERIDALVTDVIMPGASGLTLAERILDRDPAVRVVLLSGYTAENLDLSKLMALGAVFLSKPATPRQLVDAIQAAGRTAAETD